MRIGMGFDAHELEEGKRLKLGGVNIAFERGLRGHSDGDVVLHALSDAILGASATGDIGMYFRDTDETIAGMDSSRIVRFALEQASGRNMRLKNVDIVIVADQPKLNVHYEEMASSIAGICGISKSDVSVKAKTTEGTLVSRQAMACFAVVLMEES